MINKEALKTDLKIKEGNVKFTQKKFRYKTSFEFDAELTHTHTNLLKKNGEQFMITKELPLVILSGFGKTIGFAMLGQFGS